MSLDSSVWGAPPRLMPSDTSSATEGAGDELHECWEKRTKTRLEHLGSRPVGTAIRVRGLPYPDLLISRSKPSRRCPTGITH